MSEETGASAGGEAISVVTAGADAPAEFTMNHAAKALADIREKRNQSPSEVNDAARANMAGEPENELSGEDNAAPLEEAHGEDEGNDPAEQPPIDRPKSWTEAEDAEWQSTPRALQQKIVARELERDKALRQSQNDAAEKLKGLTAKEQEVEKVRQQYESKISSAMQMLEREQMRDFPDIRTMADVERMAQEDPFRKIQWDTHQQKMAVVAHEDQQAKSRKQQEEQTDWNNHVQKENLLAAEHIPELADPEKRPAFYKRAIERLAELGFKPDELNDQATGKQKLSIHDHRLQQLLASDFKLADIQKAKTVATAKPLPPVQRPGTSKPAGNVVSEQVKDLTRKLNETGDIRFAQQLRALQARRAS